MSKLYDFSRVGIAADQRIERGILPGAVICVNIDGAREYEYCGGFADSETGRVMKKDCIFRLASMTKPITAVAALIQQDRGLLSVKDKVSRFLPEFRNMQVGRLNENGEAVAFKPADRDMTIEDILTHSSGMGSGVVGDAQFSKRGRGNCVSLSEAMEVYSQMYLDFSPGSSQCYSAFAALDIVARIVELTSGVDYETFLKRNVLSPLGMKDTAYRLTDEQRQRRVTLRRLSDDGTTTEKLDIGDCPHEGFPENCVSGSACLMGTMEDYSNFAEMLCGGGQRNGVRILSEAAVRAMRTPHFKPDFAGLNEFFNWGYGVRVVGTCKRGVQELSTGSYGWSGAYNTHFWVDPALKLTGVFMSNLDNAGGAGSPTAFEFECNVMAAVRGAGR